jgi:hypothetical protein
VTFRAALYYVPSSDDPLFHAGNTWLGRDPRTNAKLPQPGIPDIESITADARLYGFHATLKPPMRLRTSVPALVRDIEYLCDGIAPFDLPALAISDLHGFVALCETTPCPALQSLADRVVAGLDDHRLPPDDAELARRRKSGLSAEREANLVRWGYPDVFNTWRFHMTLSRRLTEAEKSGFRPAAEAHFHDALSLPRRVTNICLFIQQAAGEPFTLAERLDFAPA